MVNLKNKYFCKCNTKTKNNINFSNKFYQCYFLTYYFDFYTKCFINKNKIINILSNYFSFFCKLLFCRAFNLF